MTERVLKVQLEMPQISHNLFGSSAQGGQLFKKKKHLHMSIVHCQPSKIYKKAY